MNVFVNHTGVIYNQNVLAVSFSSYSAMTKTMPPLEVKLVALSTDGSSCSIVIGRDDPVLHDRDAYIARWRAVCPAKWDSVRLGVILGHCLLVPRLDFSGRVSYKKVVDAEGSMLSLPAAVATACRECPAGAPYVLGVFAKYDDDSDDVFGRTRLAFAREWRRDFVKPAPTMTPIQGYIEACKVVDAANAAKEAALAKIKQVAGEMTCEGPPLPVNIDHAWLATVLNAVNDPGTVFRVVPKRLVALKQMGFEVEVLYTVPKIKVLKAYSNVVPDDAAEDSYIRLRV